MVSFVPSFHALINFYVLHWLNQSSRRQNSEHCFQLGIERPYSLWGLQLFVSVVLGDLLATVATTAKYLTLDIVIMFKRGKGFPQGWCWESNINQPISRRKNIPPLNSRCRVVEPFGRCFPLLHHFVCFFKTRLFTVQWFITLGK